MGSSGERRRRRQFAHVEDRQGQQLRTQRDTWQEEQRRRRRQDVSVGFDAATSAMTFPSVGGDPSTSTSVFTGHDTLAVAEHSTSRTSGANDAGINDVGVHEAPKGRGKSGNKEKGMQKVVHNKSLNPKP